MEDHGILNDWAFIDQPASNVFSMHGKRICFSSSVSHNICRCRVCECIIFARYHNRRPLDRSHAAAGDGLIAAARQYRDPRPDQIPR